jgi:hypothetical protein
MIEMGVSNYRSIDEFKGHAKRTGSKPAMMFEGDVWENEEKFSKLRNLLIGEGLVYCDASCGTAAQLSAVLLLICTL